MSAAPHTQPVPGGYAPPADVIDATRARDARGRGARSRRAPSPGEPAPWDSFQEARYFPALDGLRALSIVAVVWHHAVNPNGPWGFFGVSLFFAISGFLITTLLLRERAATGHIDLGKFYARRTLRIFPLYYATLAVYTVSVLVLDRYSAAGREFVGNLPFFLSYTSNWFVHAQSGTRTIFYFAWSLATEEQFYLCWPVTLRASAGWRRPVAIVLCVLSLPLLWQALHAAGIVENGTRLAPLTAATTIGFGCIAAYATQSRGGYERLARTFASPWAVSALLVLALAGTFAAAPQIVVSTLLALVVVAACVRPRQRHVLLAHPVLRAIGRVSYGMYLFHMLCLNVVRGVLPHVGITGVLPTFFAALLLTIGVAEVSFHTYERWFLRQAGRFRPARTPHIPVPAPL